ncbi:MAG: MMPL family transporter [Myxococcales bacterium]|nr:MMPL family transporter [Myxococcales bacterium]
MKKPSPTSRWARFSVEHRYKLLVAVALLWAAAAYVTTGLKFDSSFSALLAPQTPELVEVNRLLRRVGGAAELVVAIGGKDKQARLRFGRLVANKLRARPWIRGADVEYPIEFFLDRRLMLLSLERLEKLAKRISDEIDRARARSNPLYVDLEDDDSKKKDDKPRWQALRSAKLGPQQSQLARTFGTADGKYLFVRVKPMGATYNFGSGGELLRRIKADVASLDAARHGVTVRFAGGLEINQEQHRRMGSDLRRASLLSLVAIVLLVTVYVRRVEAVLLLAVPLVGGVVTTLGLTTLIIGQLNIVSGFLVSALFGLGIDFAIHLYLRYLERLDAGDDRFDAMRDAIAHTLTPCVTAALTTAGAFFAMAFANFRGYREYGIIAGAGVLITLVTIFVALPPLALLTSRKPRRRGRRTPRAPRRGVILAMVLIGSALFVGAAIKAPEVRWHNDFRKLRGTSAAVDFSMQVGKALGGDLSPAAVYVENLDQARRVVKYVEARWERGPSSPVRYHLSLSQMVPHRAAAKQKVLAALQTKLEKLARRPLDKTDRARVDELLRLVKVKPWTLADVPEVFRRPLSTLDGRGQLVALWPRHNTDIDREIIAWAKVLDTARRELHKLGIPAQMMDENRVSARVLSEMRADAPVVLGAAAAVVLLVLIVHFRRPRHVAIVAGSLVVGMVWMLGLLAVWNIDLNVFNQAVLATIIGVGIDNAVHIYHRVVREGPRALPQVLQTTGSAALLASVTTALGFGTAITASHLGIQSFGWLAIAGLSSVFVATTVFFPAVLLLTTGRREKGE